MLVVISNKRQRSLSGPLRKEFEDFHTKCQDSSKLDYYTKGVPPHGFYRAQTAVEVNLNDNATKTIAKHPSPVKAEIYKGKTNKSMLEEDLKNIDGIQRPELSRVASLNS